MLSNVIPIGYVHHVRQYIARILSLDRDLIMIVELKVLKDILNKIFNYFSITK